MVAVDYDKDFIDFYCQLYVPHVQKLQIKLSWFVEH